MSMLLRKLLGGYLDQATGGEGGAAGGGQPGAGGGAQAEADDLGASLARALDGGSEAQPGAGGDGKPAVQQQQAAEKEPDAAAMRQYLTENVDDPEGKLAGKSDTEIAALYKSAKGQLEEAGKEGAEHKEQSQGEKLEAPQHWSAEHRELFAKQPPEAQKFLLDRHKAMEADYTRRSQELAGVRRFKEQLDEVFSPFREAMAREGVDDVAAIRQLVSAHTYLQEEPEKGILWLAEKYGIDLSKVGAGGTPGEGGQPHPEFTKLRQTVSKLEQQLSSTQTAQQEEQHRANLLKVEQFAQEKDEKGQLKRPYFEEVAPDVAHLMRAARDAGRPIDLDQAYERAVYANPDTRAKLFAAKEAERKRAADNERRRKANAAKLAGFDVRGEGSATAVAAKTDDIAASLTAAFDAAEGRV